MPLNKLALKNELRRLDALADPLKRSTVPVTSPTAIFQAVLGFGGNDRFSVA
jgi:hypothetical protein